MSTSIQRTTATPQSLDQMVLDAGLVVAADESADAQSAQIQARAHRDAANAQHAVVQEQRRKLKEQEANAAKPSLFGKALGLVGRAFATLTTNGYSLLAEGIHLATSSKPKDGGGFFARIFNGKANALFAWFAVPMTPVAAVPAFIADREQAANRTLGLIRGQAELERTSNEIDRYRKAMSRSIEHAQVASERADDSSEEVERMRDALNAASRAATRSIDG